MSATATQAAPRESPKARKARLIRERDDRMAKGRQVVDLILGGHTVRQAAALVGISKSQADRLYHQTMEDYEEGTTDNFRERQLARLERLVRFLWPKCISGDIPSVRQAERILDQMNRLKGAYPPQGVDLTAVVVHRHDGYSRVISNLEAFRHQRERQSILALEVDAVDPPSYTRPLGLPVDSAGHIDLSEPDETNGNGHYE